MPILSALFLLVVLFSPSRQHCSVMRSHNKSLLSLGLSPSQKRMDTHCVCCVRKEDYHYSQHELMIDNFIRHILLPLLLYQN